MTTTETQFVGIAAADDLDILNSRDDFEPTTDVDTIALDATIDALAAARTVVTRLQALHDHLAAGHDAATAEGLAVEVAFAVELVAGITAAGIA